jgi:hypothetical protein
MHVTQLSPEMSNTRIANVIGERGRPTHEQCYHRSSKTLVPVFPFLARHTRGRYTEGVTDRKWSVQVKCMGV